MKDDTPELSRRPGEATPEFLVASGSTAQKIFVTRLFGAGIICGKTPCQGERCRMKLQRRLPDFAGVLSRAVFACCQRCAFGRRPRGDAHNRWPNSRCKKGIISSFSIQIICAQAGPQVSSPLRADHDTAQKQPWLPGYTHKCARRGGFTCHQEVGTGSHPRCGGRQKHHKICFSFSSIDRIEYRRALPDCTRRVPVLLGWCPHPQNKL